MDFVRKKNTIPDYSDGHLLLRNGTTGTQIP